jgi:hypothetical protein
MRAKHEHGNRGSTGLTVRERPMVEDSPHEGAAPRAKLLALAVIAGLSEGIVWVGNTHGWLATVFAAIVCGILALTTCGVVGVPVDASFRAFATLIGVFEGIVWGVVHFGWFGVVIGGLVGFVAGHFGGLLLLMLLVIVLLGFPSIRASLREPRMLLDSEIDVS